MTTDNRMNEPTEAQIEAAARALFEDPHMSADYTWAELVEDDPTRAEIWRIDARRALTAAGVAPQPACLNCDEPVAESDLKANYVGRGYVHQVKCPQVPSEWGHDRSLSAWPTVDEVRETFKKSADRLAFDRMIAEVERAAAEKALTEAANELSLMDDGGKRGLAGHSKSSASAITHRHAVAVIRARAEAYTDGKLT